MNTEPEIVHHLTTPLGIVQVTENDNVVLMSYVNDTTSVDVNTYAGKGTSEGSCGTTVYVFETDNLTVKYAELDETEPGEKYRDVVTLRFRTDWRETLIHLYLKPEVLKEAVANMTEHASHWGMGAEAGDSNE